MVLFFSAPCFRISSGRSFSVHQGLIEIQQQQPLFQIFQHLHWHFNTLTFTFTFTFTNWRSVQSFYWTLFLSLSWSLLSWKGKICTKFWCWFGSPSCPAPFFFYRSGTGLEKDLVLENYSRLAWKNWSWKSLFQICWSRHTVGVESRLEISPCILITTSSWDCHKLASRFNFNVTLNCPNSRVSCVRILISQ